MYTCPSVKCCARPGVSVYPEAKLPGRGKEKEREEGSDEDAGEEGSRADRKIGIKFLINILEDVSASAARAVGTF